MIKFPYGMSDFYEVITEEYFYVDRTAHIRLIEEFKYIKLKAAKITGEQARSMSRQQIEELEPVKTMLAEATAQVKRYQLELEEKYYGILRLRAYVVLALGFDRVVWREVA